MFLKHQHRSPDKSIAVVLLEVFLIATCIFGTACQGGTPPKVASVPTVQVPTVALIPTVPVPTMEPAYTPAQTTTPDRNNTVRHDQHPDTSTKSRPYEETLQAWTPPTPELAPTLTAVERGKHLQWMYLFESPSEELVSITISCLEQKQEAWDAIRTGESISGWWEAQKYAPEWVSGEYSEKWTYPEDARDFFTAVLLWDTQGPLGNPRIFFSNTARECLPNCDLLLQQQLLASPLVSANAENTNTVITAIQAQRKHCPPGAWNPAVSNSGISTDPLSGPVPLSLSKGVTSPTQTALFRDSPIRDDRGNIGLNFMPASTHHPNNGLTVTLPTSQSTRWMYIHDIGIWLYGR